MKNWFIRLGRVTTGYLVFGIKAMVGTTILFLVISMLFLVISMMVAWFKWVTT